MDGVVGLVGVGLVAVVGIADIRICVAYQRIGFYRITISRNDGEPSTHINDLMFVPLKSYNNNNNNRRLVTLEVIYRLI